MKIVITTAFSKFIKNNLIIIHSFLFAALIVSSFVVGFVPQIPLWVLLVTIPVSLITMILFYIKSYSYIHEHWLNCKKHKSDFEFPKSKYFKYIYFGIFLLIPLFNWIPIMLIRKWEKNKIDGKYIICKKDHLEIRSGSIKTNSKGYSKNRIEEFNKEF